MRYSNALVCDLINYIESNLYSKIDINTLSYKFSYNRYYLMKTFKRELGLSIIDYINHLRIYNSIIQIQSTDYSFTRIAINCGFSSLEYFSETFHKVMGVSAKEYKFYINKRYLPKQEKVSILLNSWFDLQSLYERVDKYKKNRKPRVVPILKKSIYFHGVYMYYC